MACTLYTEVLKLYTITIETVVSTVRLCHPELLECNRNRNSNVHLCHLDQWEQYAEVFHNRIRNGNVRLCHLDSDTQEVGILIVWQMVMDGFEWSSSWYGWTFWCLSIIVDGNGSDDDKKSSIATFFHQKLVDGVLWKELWPAGHLIILSDGKAASPKWQNFQRIFF